MTKLPPPPNSADNKGKIKYYRPDIDGLRAVAVLSVVLYHAFPHLLRGGFIGVDIFFVISGFLISGILYRNLFGEKTPGRVNIVDFYMRRIRRIFPVLIVVLLTTLAAGFLLLTPDELKLLGKHVAGGAAYVSNIVLWQEAGYFDQSAALKPLLHLWSLGVEEQFYIVWPVLLWLLYKSRLNFLTAIVLFALVSFILCMKGVSRDATAAFYAPWTRVWELAAGGILAWVVMNWKAPEAPLAKVNAFLSRVVFRGDAVEPRAWRDVLSMLGFALIVVGLCTIKHSSKFPSYNALLPVMGAVFIIAAGADAWLNRVVLSHRVAVFIGLISYPLYLWHWPLLSFEHIVWGGKPPALWRGAAVAVAILLAWVTYRYIEPPLRYGKHSTAKAVGLFVVLAAIGFGGYALYKSNGFPQRVGETISDSQSSMAPIDFERLRAESQSRCESVFPEWKKQDNKCLMQKAPGQNTVAILGDSHAGHLFAGLSSHGKYSIEMFPIGCGAPLLDVTTSTHERIPANVLKLRGEGYLRHREAFQHIAADPSIVAVVLAHRSWCSSNGVLDHRNPEEKDESKILRSGLARTFEMMQKAGKQVIVVLDDPQIPFNPSRCVVRPLTTSKQCQFPRKDWNAQPFKKFYEAAVRDVAPHFSNVTIIDLADTLCDKTTCYAVRNHAVLYRDDNHLSDAGSRLVAPVIVKAIDDALSSNTPP